MKKTVSRRTFLTRAGLTLAVMTTPSGLKVLAASQAKKGTGFRSSIWFSIHPNDRITFFLAKSEMGQGIHTALPMIVADELEADWAQIQLEAAPLSREYFDPVEGVQATFASLSIRNYYDLLRTAGAAGREMLVQAASNQWHVPIGECQAFQSRVHHRASGRVLSYGQLCGEASRLPVPESPRLKTPNEFKLIGAAVARLDIPAKVQGQARFGIDTFVPDMLYGALTRPPAYGARVISYDEEAAQSIPEVRFVGEIARGVAICADTLEAAWKGREALQVQWGPGSRPDMSTESIETTLTESLEKEGLQARSEGDVEEALNQSHERIQAQYLLPYLSHATMEPMNGTARVSADGCDVWVPTQSQSYTLETAVEVTGLKPDQIHIHTTLLGGGFGRRGGTDFVRESVELAKASGRPVKLIWTREEDLRHGVYRPGNACRIVAGVDPQGRLIAWSHKTAIQPLFTDLKSGAIDRAAVMGLGTDMLYEIPNVLVEYVPVDLPIPVYVWRSVGHSQNAFTKESFMDELAHATRQDPLEFRLRHLGSHRRALRVLEMVADKSGWNKPLGGGQARGLAFHCAYESYVAQVVEVSVDERVGAIRVQRVVCVVDCGPVVNPDTVVAQMEGSIIMGLSAALKEKVEFAQGGVKSENFSDYNLMRMDEVPDIDTYIVDSGGKIGGVGEPGIPPTAPAVANAVFAATGVRPRSLPMTPNSIKNASAQRKL